MSAPAIRATAAQDAEQVLALFRAAAGGAGGLARRPDEMDLAYVEGFLAKAPEAVVAKEKEKLATFEEKMKSLDERLQFLEKLG